MLVICTVLVSCINSQKGYISRLCTIHLYVLVIPQNEYGILVITPTEVKCYNKDTIRVNGV